MLLLRAVKQSLTRSRTLAPLASAIAFSLLTACGGGGGGSAPVNQQTSPTPTPGNSQVTITTTSVPMARSYTPYSFQFTATGGSGKYIWGLGQPTNIFALGFSSSGLLNGSTGYSGFGQITACVADAANTKNGMCRTFPFQVLQLWTWNGQSPFPAGHLNANYYQKVILYPVSAMSVTAGALPPGLQLVPDPADPTKRLITGIPTATGAYSFTLQGSSTDAPPQVASQNFTISIDSNLAIADVPRLPDTIFGQSFSHAFTAVNGVPPFQWSSSTMPNGLVLDPNTGVVSGIPNWQYPGYNADFMLTVTDSSPTPQKGSAYFTIVGYNPLGANLQNPQLYINKTVSDRFSISGGASPFTISFLSGAVPAGMSFTPTALIGRPNQLGQNSFTIQIQDSANPPQIAQFPLLVSVQAPPMSFNTSWGNRFLPVGVPFQGTVEISGGIPPYNFASSSLPAGLQLDSTLGTISGTPTTIGLVNSTVLVTDSAQNKINAPVGLNIVPALGRNDSIPTATPYFTQHTTTAQGASISPYADPITIAVPNPDQDYYKFFGSAGKTINIILSASASLSPVLRLVDANGHVFQTCEVNSSNTAFQTPCVLNNGPSGRGKGGTLAFNVPGSPGTNPAIYAHVFDWFGNARPDMIYQLGISGSIDPMSVYYPESFYFVRSNPPANGILQQEQGGVLPYTYAAVSSLPAGLTLSSAGVFGGAPTTNGNYTVNVQVTDSSNPPQSLTFPVQINVVDPVSIDPQTLPSGTVGTPYTCSITAHGGTGNYVWQNDLIYPDGSHHPFSAWGTPADGLFNVVFTQSGTYTLNMKASSLNSTDSKTFTFVIN